MLVAVIMMFLVMSFTGVATLDLSHASRIQAQGTKKNIQTQYIMESIVSKTLWRLQTDTDTLKQFHVDDALVRYDRGLNEVSIVLDTLGNQFKISLELDDATHFDYSITTLNPIKTEGNRLTFNRGISSGKLKQLPIVDFRYLESNAVAELNGNPKNWTKKKNQKKSKGGISKSGIYIINTNSITLSDFDLNSTTLVFTNPNVIVHIEGSNTILGAIYCANELNLYDTHLTGPILTKELVLKRNLELDDEYSGEYYTWPKGFGNKSDYTWPSRLKRWKTDQWVKSTSG